MAVGQFPASNTRSWSFTYPTTPVEADGYDTYSTLSFLNLNGSFPPGLYRVPAQQSQGFDTVILSTDSYQNARGNVIWSSGFTRDLYVNITTTLSVIKSYYSVQYNQIDVTGNGNATSYIQEVSYQDGKFWVIYSGALAQSTDGVTWTTSAAPWGATYNRLIFGSGETEKYLVYGNTWNTNTTAYWTSTNGTTWTTRYGPVTTHYLYQIKHYNGVYFLVGINSSNNPFIYSSTDGITWTNRYQTGVGGNPLHTILYGAGETRPYVVIGSGGDPTYDVLTSTDGVTWSTITRPSGQDNTGNRYGGIYDGGSYYVFSSQAPYTFTSTDGVTWTTSGITNYGGSIIRYNMTKFATDEYFFSDVNNQIRYTTSFLQTSDARALPTTIWSNQGFDTYRANIGFKQTATFGGNTYNYWFTPSATGGGAKITVTKTLDGYINITTANASVFTFERVGPTATIET